MLNFVEISWVVPELKYAVLRRQYPTKLFIDVHNKYFKGEGSNTPWAVVDLNA